MAKVNFGYGSSSSGHATQDSAGDCEIDCLGAQNGDPLIFNMATGQFQPFSQAGNMSQASYADTLSSLINSPTTQLP